MSDIIICIAVLRAIDTDTLNGSRDYTLLRTAFETAFRIAELRRITPASITTEGDITLITVRGKRSNIDPVAISHELHTHIKNYITLYNASLPPEDPRRINAHTPIFQTLRQNGVHCDLGMNNYDPSIGLSDSGMRFVIWTRTATPLGDEYGLKPHDCRRTFAAIAYDMGMPLPDIAKALRHKDSSVTLHYIGQKPSYEGTLITTYVKLG